MAGGHAPNDRGPRKASGSSQERQTLATITLQNFFRLYDKLAGMTGTAQTSAELHRDLQDVPWCRFPRTNRWSIADRADLIYKTEPAKFEAVADDIAEARRPASPLLIRHDQRRKSKYLAGCCSSGVSRTRLLNAKNHAREAAIIAQAAGAPAPSRSRRTWPAAVPTSCFRQEQVPSPTWAATQPGLDGRHPGEVRGGLGPSSPRCQTGRRRGRGPQRGRSPRAGHRAARVAPHRQPAAGPVRPAGRPWRVALPLAR
ncbi:hypothetical protein HBB16_11975 [Pseudonocardia sp. MCCB 268]|nr:hypothetical protein [Pseudonocardia cytotoxica]